MTAQIEVGGRNHSPDRRASARIALVNVDERRVGYAPSE